MEKTKMSKQLEKLTEKALRNRDELAFMFRYFDLPYGASYRPSVDTFSVFADFGTGTEEWKTV